MRVRRRVSTPLQKQARGRAYLLRPLAPPGPHAHHLGRVWRVAGGLVGVASGLYKFATEKPEIVTDSLKLKTNRLLNTAGEAHHQPHS